MNVEYSGYRSDVGMFCFEIPVDEKKTDYEVQLKNGAVMRQNTEFHFRTEDWNHDGDVYEQFGAFFSHSNFSGAEFLTPQDLVWLVVEEGAKIPGIENPFNRPSLDEKIREADKRNPYTARSQPPQDRER